MMTYWPWSVSLRIPVSRVVPKRRRRRRSRMGEAQDDKGKSDERNRGHPALEPNETDVDQI